MHGRLDRFNFTGNKLNIMQHVYLTGGLMFSHCE